MTVTASRFDRKDFDLYETPEWVTEVLLRRVDVRGLRVWEPAAGNHKIADVLWAYGVDLIYSTDITRHDKAHSAIFDFLSVDYRSTQEIVPASPFDAIITNPPFGKGGRDAANFARLALERCDGIVALLLPDVFDFAKTRRDLFADNPRFTMKIQLLDRIQWFPGKYGNTQNHAWYVWTGDREPWAGPPTIVYEGKEPK